MSTKFYICRRGKYIEVPFNIIQKYEQILIDATSMKDAIVHNKRVYVEDIRSSNEDKTTQKLRQKLDQHVRQLGEIQRKWK